MHLRSLIREYILREVSRALREAFEKATFDELVTLSDRCRKSTMSFKMICDEDGLATSHFTFYVKGNIGLPEAIMAVPKTLDPRGDIQAAPYMYIYKKHPGKLRMFYTWRKTNTSKPTPAHMLPK